MPLEVTLDRSLVSALVMVTGEHDRVLSFLLVVLLTKVQMLVEILHDLVTVRTLSLLMDPLVVDHGLDPCDCDATLLTLLSPLIMSSPLVILEGRDTLLDNHADVTGEVINIGDIKVRTVIIIIVSLHNLDSLKGSMQGKHILEDKVYCYLENIIVCVCLAAARG